MRFPNAAKGVSKIFTAEIIALIAAIFSGGFLFAVLLTNKFMTENNETAFDAAGISMLTLGIVAAVLLIIAGIINIIGYIQAAKDEESFKKAIYCTIAGIVFGVVGSLLVDKSGFLGWLGTTFNVVSELMTLLVFIFSIGGLMNLSGKCHNKEMVADGALLLKFISCICVLYIIILIVTRVFRENDFNKIISSICSVIATVLSIMQYILYLVYLKNAKKMLKKKVRIH